MSAARGRVLVFSVACFPPINHEICVFGSTGTAPEASSVLPYLGLNKISLESRPLDQQSNFLDVLACPGITFHCEIRQTHARELLKATVPEESRIELETPVDDAGFGQNVRMALYARWSTDGYDEAVIGAVEPVGFAATAVSVPVGGHPCAPGYSGALCGYHFCQAGHAWLRAGGSWHAGGAARAFGAAAVETVATPRGVVAAALAARAAPKPVDGDCLVAGQLDRAHAYARGTLARAHVARFAAVEDATATDGVLPARGLGGDRRRRGLSNGGVGGIIANYHMS